MTRKHDPAFTPDGVTDTAPGNPAVAHCARADSSPMHTQPGAVPDPQIIAALSPERIREVKALFSTDPLESWQQLTEKLGLSEAVVDDLAPSAALAVALLEMPEAQRHSICRCHPVESLAIAGDAWRELEASGHGAPLAFYEEFLGSEVFKAVCWRIENTPTDMAELFGNDFHLN